MTPGEAGARDLLATMTGHPALGIWSAPGRVNLIGEHTDYNEGYVLPFAIDRRTYVAVAPREDGLVRVASTFDARPVAFPAAHLNELSPADLVEAPEWAAYPLGVAWAAVAAADGADGPELPGLDLAFASDVPVGAGLSSSAALECATAVALNDVWELRLDRAALAGVGRRAENDVVGAPTGIMDQTASMFGAADSAVFLDCRTLHSEVVPLGFGPAGIVVLLIDTGVTHAHSTGGYRERREQSERAAREMGVPSLRELTVADLDRASARLDDVVFRRLRHVVTENQRVLETVRTLRSRGAVGIGDLLVASHASLRDDFEISIPELDTAVQAALDAGAIGARMTGGGFGGAALALVAQERVEAVRTAVTDAFAAAGFADPKLFPVVPAGGARRDW